MKKVLFLAPALILGVLLAGCASGGETAPPPETGPGEFAPRVEYITIQNGDHEIPAILTLPEGAEDAKFPVVVMCHGYGSDKNEAGDGYERFAPILAQNGIASLRFDFMGTGESTADFVNFTYDAGVSDADATAAYLASHPNVDPDRIGIMGWSLGGTIAMLAAGRNGTYKSLVTWAGSLEVEQFARDDEFYAEAQRRGFVVEEFDWRAPLRIGLGLFESVRNTDVLAEFGASAAPVLAINGDLDTTVAPENADRIVAASKNAESRAMIIPGADHTFNIFTTDLTCFNSVMDETVTWFKSTL